MLCPVLDVSSAVEMLFPVMFAAEGDADVRVAYCAIARTLSRKI